MPLPKRPQRPSRRCIRVLPWFCLLFFATTSAYGLQLTATAILPTAPRVPTEITNLRGYTFHDDTTTSTHALWITALDVASGERVEVQCATTTDRIAIDALLVEMKDLGDIADLLCIGPGAPVPRPESVS